MTMGSLPTQPVELDDFSGGLTDNILQGDPKRYAKADNFLITVDRKLETRPGTTLYDPIYTTLVQGSRVAGLFTAINETVLFAHSNRNIYTQSPGAGYGVAWAAIQGPSGNEALSSGTEYDQVTTGEFQRQVYYTSSAGVQPGKLFRDHTNAWKAVTAGVPKLSVTPNYADDAAIVTACITLANALRSSFISHFNDHGTYSGGTTGVDLTKQHKYFDKWSASYLTSVAAWDNILDPEYPGPDPAPTPAPAASDAASLYTLCLALSLAYEHHRNDLAGTTPTAIASQGSKYYHNDTYVYPHDNGTYLYTAPDASAHANMTSGYGLAARLSTSGVVSTPKKAALFLDDLAQKWYWHQLLPFAHIAANNWSSINRWLLTGSGNDSVKVGTIYSDTTTLQAAPNYGPFIDFAYFIKQALVEHTQNATDIHSQQDFYSIFTTPDPVDYDSAVFTIFAARWLYGKNHVYDSNFGTHTRVTFDCTNGSTSLTNVKTTSSGAALTLPVGSVIVMVADTFNETSTVNRRSAFVTASGSGTATLSRSASLTNTGNVGQYSTAWAHGAYWNGVLNNASCDTTTFHAQAAEFLQNPADVATSMSGWITLGVEFLTCLTAHIANANLAPSLSSHKFGSTLYLGGYGPKNGNPFYVPTAIQLAWAAYYQYRYTVEQNGIIYLNRGAPIYSNSITTCPSFPVNTVLAASGGLPGCTIINEKPCATLSGLPGLANTSITNYDTGTSVAPTPTTPGSTGYNQNFTIELFRTTDGGTTFYYLDSLTNTVPTQSYTDTTNENYPKLGATALNLQPVMYTSGGVLANDQPPLAKFVHQFAGFVYYGAITDTGQYFPQRIRQALQGSPDSAPATCYLDLEDELSGLSSTRSNLIAFCKNSLFRITGSFTSTGQGSMTPDRISDQIGNLNAKGIVKTEIGVFFAGSDGFYYTDGYQLIKISLELDKTYLALTQSEEQKARIYGSYDKHTRRVWWSMQSQPQAKDNDVFFVFYLDYGVKPSGTFTKALTTQSWMPASHVFFQRKLIIGDSRGYLFKTDSATKTDPLVDTTLSPSSWLTTHIPWDFTSCALDFGSTAKRKYIPKLHCVGQNVGNAAIQVNSINGLGSQPNGATSTLPLAPIQYTRNLTWGDARVVWGDEAVAWKYDGTMDLWRRFPSRSLRSDFKQIQYLPGSFVIYKSDDFPQFAFATVDAGALTATLQTPSGYTALTWPNDVVDCQISFDTDSYATKYTISQVATDVITFTDPSGTVLASSGAKWQITGIRKEQRIRITSINIHFAPLGDEFEAYPGASEEGGEGANS